MVSGCALSVANRNSMVALQGIQTTLFLRTPLLHWALVLVLSQAPSLALVPLLTQTPSLIRVLVQVLQTQVLILQA